MGIELSTLALAQQYTKDAIREAQLSGSGVDLSDYYTKTEVENAIDINIEELSEDIHTHDNKGVLDSVTAERIGEWDDKATTKYVDDQIAQAQLDSPGVDLTGYATKEDLDDYVGDDELSEFTNSEIQSLWNAAFAR